MVRHSTYTILGETSYYTHSTCRPRELVKLSSILNQRLLPPPLLPPGLPYPPPPPGRPPGPPYPGPP